MVQRDPFQLVLAKENENATRFGEKKTGCSYRKRGSSHHGLYLPGRKQRSEVAAKSLQPAQPENSTVSPCQSVTSYSG